MFTFDLPLKTKMATMTGIAIGGLLLFGWVASGTLEELKVNGPLYRSITESKDMVADYVPPDGSVIEAFTLVGGIEDQVDDSKRNSLTDKLRKKRADESAVFDLHKAQGDGEMRKAVAAVHSTAVTFFDAVDSGYLPRIAAKDRSGGAEFRIRRLGTL